MFAGPSAPAASRVRIAPVTTTGWSPRCSRSSRKLVSSIVSVPCTTTAPAQPASSSAAIASDRSSTSPMVSAELGSWRKSCSTGLAGSPGSPGTEPSSCDAPRTGAAPGEPGSVIIAIVPPSVNTAIRGGTADGETADGETPAAPGSGGSPVIPARC
jgi:hypothetical protein